MSSFLKALVATLALLMACISCATAEQAATLTFQGVTLAYWQIPSQTPDNGAPPIYVLHGGPGFDHKYLSDSPGIKLLARDRTVILYDQRGVGDSGALREGQSCTVSDQVEDLERLRQHLGHEQIDLAGHSWGGFLAMAYVQKYPARVAHLVLIDSMPMRYDDDYAIFESAFPAEYAEMREQRMIALFKSDVEAEKKSLRAYMSMLFVDPAVRDRFLAGAADYTSSNEVNRALNSDASGMDLTEVVRHFPNPILIVHGDQDANISVASAEVMASTISVGDFARVADCGHLPFYEKPEEFAELTREFLAMYPALFPLPLTP